MLFTPFEKKHLFSDRLKNMARAGLKHQPGFLMGFTCI